MTYEPERAYNYSRFYQRLDQEIRATEYDAASTTDELENLPTRARKTTF
jgi:hypothetical protein